MGGIRKFERVRDWRRVLSCRPRERGDSRLRQGRVLKSVSAPLAFAFSLTMGERQQATRNPKRNYLLLLAPGPAGGIPQIGERRGSQRDEERDGERQRDANCGQGGNRLAGEEAGDNRGLVDGGQEGADDHRGDQGPAEILGRAASGEQAGHVHESKSLLRALLRIVEHLK